MNSGDRLALEQARRDGYLVQNAAATDNATSQAFRQWCREQGRPFAVVENKEASASLLFDTGSVWEHFQQQYPFLREQPTFFTLDPTEELQTQLNHIVNATDFQGGAGIGGTYTWIAQMSTEHAIQTVQALLALWERAWTFHADRLRDTSFSAE
ncbi:MAG TPA: hypothetical protein VGU68_04470 [Ktedonobacteraceae bacterium]|nr:hypothetical protein [Ktedonobacteraceae bacterium]